MGTKISEGKWFDLGVPMKDGYDPDGTIATALGKDSAYIAIGNVLYKKGLTSNDSWVVLKEFENKKLPFANSVSVIPGKPDVIIVKFEGSYPSLPLAISHDGGSTWSESGKELLDPALKDYQIPGHAVLDDSGAIFMSTGPFNVVRSNDKGRTWTYVFGEPRSAGCYTGIIAPSPTDKNVLYNGVECPLDSAKVFALDLTASQGMTSLLDRAFLGNRRPNSLKFSPHDPNILLVGAEGSLVRYNIKTKAKEYLLLSGITGKDDPSWITGKVEPPREWYAYITDIWFNPNRPGHFIVSGFPKRRNDFFFFETIDDGKTFQSLAPNESSRNNATIGPFFSSDRLIVASMEKTGIRVWMYKPNP